VPAGGRGAGKVVGSAVQQRTPPSELGLHPLDDAREAGAIQGAPRPLSGRGVVGPCPACRERPRRQPHRAIASSAHGHLARLVRFRIAVEQGPKCVPLSPRDSAGPGCRCSRTDKRGTSRSPFRAGPILEAAVDCRGSSDRATRKVDDCRNENRRPPMSSQ